MTIRVLTGDWRSLGEAAMAVRNAVFVGEQGIPAAVEVDGRDPDCLHCVVWIDGEAVATGRLLPDAHIGRMAVLAGHRRRGLGGVVLRALIDAAAERGDREVELSAQAYVTAFYARHGFTEVGEPFDEVGIEHRRMRLTLGDTDRSARSEPAPPVQVPVRLTERIETMGDGIGLHLRDWNCSARRGVYLLHGLGEHIGRYETLARWFCARGWRVRGHDHVGHGHSGGRRGVLARERQLVEHARTLFERFADELETPPLLLGHSLGGALAAELVICERLPVRGLILSSPALQTDLGRAQRLLAAVLARLAPNLAVRNGLDPEALSHDPAVVRAYLEDPQVHDRISARLLGWLQSAGERARAAAPTLACPTLLLVAGDDRLVDSQGSRAFADAAPAQQLSLHWYDKLYHELFNEDDAGRQTVLADLERWLRRFDD